ncbi:MAG: hypothetical protein WKF84_27590 [Pyrinomonadaceae bacterium]
MPAARSVKQVVDEGAAEARAQAVATQLVELVQPSGDGHVGVRTLGSWATLAYPRRNTD